MKHAVGVSAPSLDGRFKLSRTARFAAIDIGGPPLRAQRSHDDDVPARPQRKPDRPESSPPAGPEAVDEVEDRRTHELLIQKLTEAGVVFKHITHVPVRTSEEAAQIRGAPLHSGAKAMFMLDKRTEEGFLIVMSAVKKADWKKIKAAGYKQLRMATEEEVRHRTGCLPGAVPPFGSLFNPPARTLVDVSLRAINFNCGLRTDSVQMSVADYEHVERPNVLSLAS